MPTFPSSVPKAKQPSFVGCQDNCKQNRKRPIMTQATDTLFLNNKQKENAETDEQAPSLIPTLPTTPTWFDHAALSIEGSPPTSYCGIRWKGLKALKYYLTSTLRNRNGEYYRMVRKLLVWTRITTMFYCCQQFYQAVASGQLLVKPKLNTSMLGFVHVRLPSRARETMDEARKDHKGG